MTITLTQDQERARELLVAWWESVCDDTNPIPFILHGYAGTGKTTVVLHLLEALGLGREEVALLAPTGKAARVLAKRTGLPTSTIHRALYRPRGDSVIEALRTELREAKNEDHQVQVSTKLAREEKERGVSFDAVGGEFAVKLIVVDEVSMVSERLAQDLEATSVPLLLIGDPGQLPPVKAKVGWADWDPDVVLEEILRQDAGSAILKAAELVRKKEVLDEEINEGAFRRVLRKSLTDEYICEEFDIMLCGTHRVRRAFNKRLRRVMFPGAETWYPVVGDRLVCKMNSYPNEVFNGQLFSVKAVGMEIDPMRIELTIADDAGWTRSVVASTLRFKEHYQKGPVHLVENAIELDFAYALTVHSAQGSEWDNVVVVNDWAGGEYHRWLYTALTRGAKHVTMIG